MKLSGNTILITGGSSGIGLGLAKVLLNKSNEVIICSRSLEKLNEVKSKLPSIHIFQCDLAVQNEREKLYSWIRKNHPQCNILINNAGYANRMNIRENKDYLLLAEHELQTNFIAPVSLVQLFLAQLEAQKNSAIINVTSGLVYLPAAKQPIYCASKAALHSFTQTLRFQLKESSIMIIEVFPPVVDTPFHNGKVPRGAVSVDKAVAKIIHGIEGGKEEIVVGLSRFGYYLSRFAPSFGLKKVNER